MALKADFDFKPLFNRTRLKGPEAFEALTKAAFEEPLGPLADLPGTWEGTGFNMIWRPLFNPKNPGVGHFLELNVTNESLQFQDIGGEIPNRGLFQQDIFMTGVSYIQRVNDANADNAGLHFEPGVWLNIPQTTDPAVPPSVARLGSIPHGTTVLAQGEYSGEDGAPWIAPVGITPFRIGNPGDLVPFPEEDLSIPSEFRSPVTGLTYPITQAMVTDPNSVLRDAIAGETITQTTNLIITTLPEPIVGGGTANTAFLVNPQQSGPNADAAAMTSIFWIEKLENGDLWLQYTQTVLLDFGGLSWPHVSVATLKKVAGS